MSGARRRRAPLPVPLVLLVLVVALAAAACTGVPESGPVVSAGGSRSVDTRMPSDINVVPPADGASALEVVGGFLDAMTASPIRIDIAKQYLTESAAAAWDPEAATLTYGDKLPAREEGDRVVVQLAGAERLDRTGAFQGAVPAGRQELRFEVGIDAGEFRITNPPNALVVPASWFAQRYQRVSLYFFDTTAQILVPEPVFAPTGEQLATSLISGLLDGPGPELRGVSRSFLPGGLSIGLSVPISADGVADIALLGQADSLTDEATTRMFAQLAWTLRQDPDIRAFRLTIGGVDVQPPGTGGTYTVDRGFEYDPSGYGATSQLFALRRGQLVSGTPAGFNPTSGPFGAEAVGLRVVAVDLDGETAAAVTADGRTLLRAPVMAEPAGDGEPDATDDGAVSVALDGATDLLAPVWDFTGRLWTVDRTASGAVVRYVERGTEHRIRVPGVSGRDVTGFLVSRDGTRFVAVVRGEGADELRVGRISLDDAGEVMRATPTVVLLGGARDQIRIRDLAWTSPTTLALLSPVRSAQVSEIRSISVDGGSASSESLLTTVPGRVVGLAGNPAVDSVQYAVTRTGLIDLTSGTLTSFQGRLASVDYAR